MTNQIKIVYTILYIYHKICNRYVHFLIVHGEIQSKTKRQKVTRTDIYGDKLEVYPTNEFGIFLKDAPNYPKDGVHDGFNDISPPQEMTLMGSTSPDYLD